MAHAIAHWGMQALSANQAYRDKYMCLSSASFGLVSGEAWPGDIIPKGRARKILMSPSEVTPVDE